MSAELADEIRATRFTPVRLGGAYSMQSVDALLDQLEDAARGGRPLAPVVDAGRLDNVRFREGYDPDEVDAFLRRLRESGATRPSPLTSAPPVPSTVIAENRGLLSRIFGRER